MVEICALTIVFITLTIIIKAEFVRYKIAKRKAPEVDPVEIDIGEFGKIAVTPKFVDAFKKVATYYSRYKHALKSDRTNDMYVMGKQMDASVQHLLAITLDPEEVDREEVEDTVIKVDFGKGLD